MTSRIATTAPRWKTALEDALTKYKNQTVIQIATLDSTSTPDGSLTIPRVRSHIFREFLSKPEFPSLPLLISSTDVRTSKVSQLTSSPKAEIVWWIDGTQQQFRLKSNIYIVPHPTHPTYSAFKRALESANADDAQNDAPALSLFKDEDWEKRRIDLFETMSAHMKASWCRPTPGTILGGEGDTKKWPERVDKPDPNSENYEKQKQDWDFALSNFAMVIIEPYEVDFVDLKVLPNRRWLFNKKKDGNDWVWGEIELVP